MVQKNNAYEIVLFLKKLCTQLLQIVLSVAVLMIACVLPIYFENGFTTIGSDKHSFFRFISTTVMYMAGVLLLIRGTAEVLIYYGFKKKEESNQWWKKQLNLSVPDKFLLFYAAVVFLSFLFSPYKKEALWGTNGWFMGIMPQFLFLGYYVLLSRVWKRVNWIYGLFIVGSSVSFVMCILNRFSIYPIDMHSTNASFISTIGNMNWFCGYWSTCVFLGIAAFWLMKREWFCRKDTPGFYVVVGMVVVTLYMCVSLLAGLLQGSDSGFLALGTGLLFLLALSSKEEERMLRVWEIGLILCLLTLGIRFANEAFPERLNFISTPLKLLIESNITILLTVVCLGMILLLKWCRKKGCYPVRGAVWTVRILLGAVGIALVCFVVLIVVNTLYPGSIGKLSEVKLFIFDGNWGSLRGATWTSGLWAFWNQNWLHKLIGVGPDCMAAYLYSGADEVLEEYTNYWMSKARLTNAHNEWITVLLNMGILGLIGWVGAIISGIVRFVKNRKVHWFVAGAALCLFSYTINNMFSFQQTNNGAALFLIWGIAEGYLKEQEDKT